MFKLVIADDEGKTTSVPLVREEITIGRKEGNTIRLTDRNVSRRHARLQKQNGHYLLQDLGSYNGIVINGARLVDTQPLKHGDQILIGDYKLAISEEATNQVAVPPPPGNSQEHFEPTVPVSTVSAGAPTPGAGVHPQRAQTLLGTPPPSPFGAPPQPTAVTAAPISSPPAAPTQAVAVPMPSSGEVVPDEIRQMRLVFLAPPGAPAAVSLERLPMILGRSEAADVALPYSSISREHARLSVQGGALIVEDLGSSNGVVVNGTKAARTVLSPGDLVTLGVVEFRLARRGDNTVIMQREPYAPARRSPAPILFAVIGAVAVLGGVIFALKASGLLGGGRAPTVASAPVLSTASAGPTAGPPPSTVIPTRVQPVPLAAVEPVMPVQPSPVVAMAVAPLAPDPRVRAVEASNDTEPPPERSETHHSHSQSSHSSAGSSSSSNEHASSSTTSSTTTSAPAPQPQTASTSSTTSSSTSGTSSSNSGSGSSSSGGDPMAQARACHNDNQCVIGALQGHAQTEPELALLAVTYRLSGNRNLAVRTMNSYLRRFPSGPRADSFRSFIENQ